MPRGADDDWWWLLCCVSEYEALAGTPAGAALNCKDPVDTLLKCPLICRDPIDLSGPAGTTAAHFGRPVAVTNDNIRDHRLAILQPEAFDRFCKSQLLRFDFCFDAHWVVGQVRPLGGFAEIAGGGAQLRGTGPVTACCMGRDSRNSGQVATYMHAPYRRRDSAFSVPLLATGSSVLQHSSTNPWYPLCVFCAGGAAGALPAARLFARAAALRAGRLPRARALARRRTGRALGGGVRARALERRPQVRIRLKRIRRIGGSHAAVSPRPRQSLQHDWSPYRGLHVRRESLARVAVPQRQHGYGHGVCAARCSGD